MEDIVNKFYGAFKDLKAEEMVSCYHPQIAFSDPAFGTLKGERAKNMWRMLIRSQRGKEFLVDYQIIRANSTEAKIQWEAQYTFSKTGRKVHNRIKAAMVFKDGLIYEHLDEFSLHDWAAMAIGWKGRLFGGTSFFRKKLQKNTNRLLDSFEENNK